MAPFLADLQAYWAQWQAAYQALTARFSALTPFVAPWQQRCQAAGILIAEMSTRAGLNKT